MFQFLAFNLVSRYSKLVPQAIEGREYGIRGRCYLKKDEEAEFLKPFLDAVLELVGDIASVIGDL